MDSLKIDLPGYISMNIVYTALAIIIVYILRSLILRIIHRNMKDLKLYYKTRRTINYIYFGVVLLLLISIWSETSSMSTYLGLASAGIAIALSDLLVNIAAFVFMIFKKPFSVGDRIEINGHAGDVIDQRLFQFTVMEIGNWVSNDQSTGRMIHIPNRLIFNHPLFNYNAGFKFIWHEVHVMLTFESNHNKAKEMFLNIAGKYTVQKTDTLEKELKEASRKYLIYYNNLTPIVYTDVKDSGIVLSIRYLCEPQKRRTTHEKVWEDILDITNREEDINLAYNTMRFVSEQVK
ncbi:mechanosensitive ion channel family protein [Acidaminobacter sp. JC074]|uniref:mechanosensitive ion channel family protein n=1 Tax=Acidaminobacter sp. JC074 TaxID=2530199 RepID=UPI001F0F18E2|nr:mechanosensitive ion channel family protein [Acidaminobacter sp. JC074]MCH4887644.1 mechanosensitive ion channel family protein [Acidaminobacter sp. JC074]